LQKLHKSGVYMSHPHRVKQVNIAKTTQVCSVHVASTSSQTSNHCKNYRPLRTC